jgi:lysophospholipase L1-like esterase
MSRRLFLWLFAALPLAGLFSVPNLGAQTQKPIRIAILGDSIDADEPPARPIQGWGTYLQPRFANASVTNLALSGRSTKTYLYGDLDKQGVRGEPKFWNRAKVTPADYWIIKFGGNDSHSPPEDKHTEPAEYAANLKTIIKTARQLGITPILCTPFRRPFKKGALTNELDPYAKAARQVAADEHVALIDVYAHATEWFTSLGPDKLTAYLPTDLGGHMNRAGAELMAEWMARELVPIIPGLELAPASAAAGN